MSRKKLALKFKKVRKMETTDDVRKECINPHSTGPEKSVTRTPKDCRFFHSCSASLCPLDPEVSKKVWLPEENDTYEICRTPEFAGLQFVKTQRKIANALRKRPGERDDYFTFEMLNRDITVRSKIRGAPSDPPDSTKNAMNWYEKKERMWLIEHPQKKKLSIEEVQRRKSNMKAVRRGRLRK